MGTRPHHTLAYRKLCRRLGELRTESGQTMRGLAEALKKPHSYVYKVEHGERRIDPVEFVQWCRACGADPADEVDRIKP